MFPFSKGNCAPIPIKGRESCTNSHHFGNHHSHQSRERYTYSRVECESSIIPFKRKDSWHIPVGDGNHVFFGLTKQNFALWDSLHIVSQQNWWTFSQVSQKLCFKSRNWFIVLNALSFNDFKSVFELGFSFTNFTLKQNGIHII